MVMYHAALEAGTVTCQVEGRPQRLLKNLKSASSHHDRISGKGPLVVGACMLWRFSGHVGKCCIIARPEKEKLLYVVLLG
jgi:uncharacterized protein YjeT (DUF2065 family)